MREAAQRAGRAARVRVLSRRALFPERIHAARVTLRPMTVDDAPAWKRLHEAIARRMPWPGVPGIVYARNELLHYEALRRTGERIEYAIIDDATGAFIGDFHLTPSRSFATDRRAEFGHALDPRVWGTGITHEILDAVARVCARLRVTLWCAIEEGNERAWRSLEKHAPILVRTGRQRVDGKTARMSARMRIYELPTTFSQRVYGMLQRVPRGKVTTYADLAHALGVHAPRAVGQALRKNPYAPAVPCHRVVAADGRIGGFMGETGGAAIAKKTRLLAREGVRVNDGEVVGFAERRHRF